MADYSIIGDTRLDASGFNKGLSTMSVVAGNVISDIVKTATGKLAQLTTASVGVGMSFQASMSQVAATMGVSTEEIQSLTDKAREMGSTTAFTATQAADALNYLALAGYDADKAAEVLPSVLNLAAAGGMDLAYASDLVTDAMASLNIEATKQNVDRFGDQLAMAASKANANVSQLGEAILTVGGTAANLKEGTTELTTALGLLANVGIKGAEGGTHLRNIILSLQSPTKDARAVMDELGLAVYDAEGNMRGLDDILTDLNDAMAGMSQGDKDGIINSLFNKTDLAAVNGLLAAQGEQWETLASQIGSASGSMGQMADTQLDNLQGAVTIAQSALEGLQLAIYDELEPTLTEAAKWGSETLSTLTASLKEGGPQAMLDAASVILQDLAAGILQQLPGLASTATQTITQLTAYLADHMDAIFDVAVQLLQGLVQGITDNFPALITAAAGLIAQFAAALIAHLPEILDCGAQLLAALAQGIVRGIENLAEAALACIAKLLGLWDGSMDDWGHIGENLVAGLLNGITGAWTGLVKSVQNKVSGLVGTVKDLLGIHSPSKVFEEIGLNICRGLAQGLETGAPVAEAAAKNVIASVTDTATTLKDRYTETVQTTTEILADGTEQQKQVITTTGTEIIDGVERTVKTVTTLAADGTRTVAKTIEDAGPQFGSAGELLVYQFRSGLENGWEEINASLQTNALGSIQTLASAIQNGDVAQLGQWAAAIFWHACTEEQRTQIQTLAMEALNRLTSSLQGVGTNLVSLAVSLVSRFVPAAGAAATAQAALNAVMDANPILLVVSLIGMLVGALGSFTAANRTSAKGVRSVWSGIGDFMSMIFEGLLRVVAVGIEGFILLINGLIFAYNAVAWLWDGQLDYVKNPAWAYANKLRQERLDRKNQLAEENAKADSSTTKKVIASLTDTSKVTNDDGSTTTTKILTEKLQDEAGNITTQVTKTVTEAGTKIVNGIERAYKTVTTFVDGVQTKVETSLDDLQKTTSSKPEPAPTPGTSESPAPTPDDSALKDNTAAILEANKKLAEMVKNANALVLTDNRVIGARVAASGSAQVAAAANNYHREGDTNITQNFYNGHDTAAEQQREARWEADRAKATKR